MRSPGTGHRHARLQQLLHEELNGLVRDDVADPDLFGVVFTSVELSVDYRNARVRFAVPGEPAPNASLRQRRERALARAAPFLRAQLATTLDAKFVPALRFVLDPDPPAMAPDTFAEHID
jgi:ribosome-binding factor A